MQLTKKQLQGYITFLEDRVIKLEKALEPFSHDDLCILLGGNCEGGESKIYGRNKAILKLKDFRKAKELLNEN